MRIYDFVESPEAVAATLSAWQNSPVTPLSPSAGDGPRVSTSRPAD